ncbi:hypothetical protein [Streptomyces sp. NPDC054765]
MPSESARPGALRPVSGWSPGGRRAGRSAARHRRRRAEGGFTEEGGGLTLRERKKLRTRQWVFGEATLLFIRRGFGNVTVAEVAGDDADRPGRDARPAVALIIAGIRAAYAGAAARRIGSDPVDAVAVEPAEALRRTFDALERALPGIA